MSLREFSYDLILNLRLALLATNARLYKGRWLPVSRVVDLSRATCAYQEGV